MSEQSSALEKGQSGHNKLFSKHRWKKQEDVPQRANQQVNDDVADFLKPSTNRAKLAALNAPRIDVSAAQRWPGASDIGKPSPGLRTPSSMRGKGISRAKRLNLRVNFARTAPEVIGEGGDEAEQPVLEIRRGRAPQTGSARTPQAMNSAYLPGDIASSLENVQLQRRSHEYPSQYQPGRPPPPPRKGTPPPQQSPVNPPDAGGSPEDGGDFRPGPLKRTPTGWSSVEASQEDLGRPSLDSEYSDYGSTHRQSLERQEHRLSSERLPEIDQLKQESPKDFLRRPTEYLRAEPSDQESVSAKVIRKMKEEEGRALHEAVHNPDYHMPENTGRNSAGSGLGGYQGSSWQQEHGFADAPPATRSRAAPRDSGSSYLEPMAQGRDRSTSPRSFPTAAVRAANLLRKPVNSSRRSPSSQEVSSQGSSMRPTPSPSNIPPPPGPYYASGPGSSSGDVLPVSSGPQASAPASVHQVRQPPPAQYDRGDSFSGPAAAPSRNTSTSAAAGEAALGDFAGRVTHMRAIFRLNAEMAGQISDFSPSQWLRAGAWWFVAGRMAMEVLLRNRPRGLDGRPSSMGGERLTQPHVDLAKCWWIVTEIIPSHIRMPQFREASNSARAAEARAAGDDATAEILESIEILLANLKALLSSMRRNQAMPPTQALIQGQDQTIWVKYPRFAPDVQSILSGQATRSLTAAAPVATVPALAAMPVADNKLDFSYGRMFVNVHLATDSADTDRVSLPCVLSILRPRNDWQLKVMIASQTELVNVCVQSDRRLGPTWDEVKWRSQSYGLYIQLPRGFTLTVECSEMDFKTLWGNYDYTRKVEGSLVERPDERLVHEVVLPEFQYVDTRSPPAFPPERTKRCRMRVFEKVLVRAEGTGQRILHRGFRLLVVTSPKNKTLSTVSHSLGVRNLIAYQLAVDPLDGQTPVMKIVFRENKQQGSMLLIFQDEKERQATFIALHAKGLLKDESLYCGVRLRSFSVEPSDQAEGFTRFDPLARLEWRDVEVINKDPDSPSQDTGRTVLSDRLRVVTRSTASWVTDRINLGPGELQLRLHTDGKPDLTVLRGPQEDITMSVDITRVEPAMPDALSELLRAIFASPTIRTYHFYSLQDLHDFQKAITGFAVHFDGIIPTFDITRRRSAIPKHKHWTTTNPRVQILQHDTVFQLAAFFDDFSHGDAMNFQIKVTDVFEKVDLKGSAKYGVKLDEAKFALPQTEKSHPATTIWERKCVNLDCLDYPGEHDDITLGFETSEARDVFLRALPAAAQLEKGFSFKRKI